MHILRVCPQPWNSLLFHGLFTLLTVTSIDSSAGFCPHTPRLVSIQVQNNVSLTCTHFGVKSLKSQFGKTKTHMAVYVVITIFMCIGKREGEKVIPPPPVFLGFRPKILWA